MCSLNLTALGRSLHRKNSLIHLIYDSVAARHGGQPTSSRASSRCKVASIRMKLLGCPQVNFTKRESEVTCKMSEKAAGKQNRWVTKSRYFCRAKKLLQQDNWEDFSNKKFKRLLQNCTSFASKFGYQSKITQKQGTGPSVNQEM